MCEITFECKLTLLKLQRLICSLIYLVLRNIQIKINQLICQVVVKSIIFAINLIIKR